MSALTLDVPLAKPLPSGTNLREHPMARHTRVKKLRHQTSLHLRARGAAFLREWRVIGANPATRIAVTLTRISPAASTRTTTSGVHSRPRLTRWPTSWGSTTGARALTGCTRRSVAPRRTGFGSKC